MTNNLSKLQVASSEALKDSLSSYKSVGRLFAELYILKAITCIVLATTYYNLSDQPSFIPVILLGVSIGFDIAALLKKPYKTKIYAAMEAYSKYRILETVLSYEAMIEEAKPQSQDSN